MANAEQIQDLQRSKDREAEILLLKLMIPHHEAGIQMAQAAVKQTDNPQVRQLATKMVSGQRNEITVMQKMLRDRQRDH